MLNINQKEKQRLIELAQNILHKRQKILFESISMEKLNEFQLFQISQCFEKNVQNLDQISYESLMFQVSLIINGTKCFESFCLDQDGKRRFMFCQEDLENTIHINIFNTRIALYNNVKVKPYTEQHVIDLVGKNIRQNYEITKLIAGKDFTREKLDQFLSIQEYKAFELLPQYQYRGMTLIQALSSYDGKIVYIRDDLINTFGEGYNDVEPDYKVTTLDDGVLACESHLAFIWLIEYQLMENLSRWSSKSHILSISPERNMNLRDKNNRMLGSGNFYLTRAHKYDEKWLNPFQMNNKVYVHQDFWY